MRASLVVALAAGVTATACAPVASRLSDTRPQPGPDYFYADVSKGKGRAIERLADPNLVTSRYGHAKRRTTYVIQDGGVAGIPRFGFHVVDKATLTVDLDRISDVGGNGIDKGSVRREASMTRDFAKDELYLAFELLQGLASDPIATLKAEAPEQWATVGQTVQIDTQEAGFAIGITAELQTGNPFDPNARVTLYRLESRSPYQRAEDAPTSPPANPPASPAP